MRSTLTIAATLLVFCFLQFMLAATSLLYEHEAITVTLSRDLVVGMSLLFLLARMGARRWWAFLVGLVWLMIVLFDVVRDIGAVTMGQDPLLYDAILLTAHLLVLLRDTLGTDTSRIVGLTAAGLGLSLLTTWGSLFWLMGRYRTHTWRLVSLAAVLMCGATAFTMSEHSPWPSRLSGPALVENAHRSAALWLRLRKGLSGEAHAEAVALDLQVRPDVHIYIVESYGRIMNRKVIRKAWKDRLAGMGRAFRKDGWFMATGLSQAPVSGGRSWLADATFFSGIEVKHESVYRHLVPRAREIPSLVRLFENNGYRTILVRPKDKARRGVKLVNHFGFEETIFFDDLEYTGTNYGWAGIPDQFTLGKLRDEVLPQEPDRPTFLFFHMATSHIPWNELPPVVEDWRRLSEVEGKPGRARVARRSKKKEIEFQLARYKRSEEVRVNRLRASVQNLGQYAKAIDYELQILTQHVLDLPEKPSMVILMGDHQPPMMGRSSDFSVPVHVLTRKPLLRKEFIEQGFEKGLQVQMSRPTVRHEALFSVIARALARQNRSELPPYLPFGAVQGKEEPPQDSRVVTEKVAK